MCLPSAGLVLVRIDKSDKVSSRIGVFDMGSSDDKGWSILGSTRTVIKEIKYNLFELFSDIEIICLSMKY
jgi:hypothetical protein